MNVCSGHLVTVFGNWDPWLPSQEWDHCCTVLCASSPFEASAVCIKSPLRSVSQWVMVPIRVPPAELGGTRVLRSRPPASFAGCCFLMENKLYRIYWNVQRNRLSLQYVHPGWIISCHFSLTIWETDWPWLWAVSSSLVRAKMKGQRWSWAPLGCIMKCSSSTSKLASDK